MSDGPTPPMIELRHVDKWFGAHQVLRRGGGAVEREQPHGLEVDGQGGPVVGAAEAPWLDAPSVYGPLATGEQALVARIGRFDRDFHDLIAAPAGFYLLLVGAAAFGQFYRTAAAAAPVAAEPAPAG